MQMMKQIVLTTVAVAALATSTLAQSPVPAPWPSPGSANVRCVMDSFGNYTCSDGTRIIREHNGNFTIIPPPQQSGKK
jgi:hypothetical protein